MKKLPINKFDCSDYEWVCDKHGRYISAVPKCLECYPIKQIKKD